MKVILNKDIKDLGKIGEMVQVKAGFARNFLFPRKLAVEATEKRMKEFKHLQMIAESKKQKAVESRKDLLKQIEGTTLEFKVEAAEDEKLFGSISVYDVSKSLEQKGFEIDKRDIKLENEEPVKYLGQHKAMVVFGEGLEAEITLAVERKSEVKAED